MPLRRVVVAFAVVALGATPSAQEPAQTPVFRSGTDVVRFDLRVVDGAGRPITDLKPDEVEIREGDERRPVLVFQQIDEPAGTYVEAAVRAVSAEVSSNQGSPRGHLYILVFDQQHITAGNEQPARLAAEAFITRRVRPSDRVAVFGLPGPGPSTGFTADRSKAIAELQRVRGGLERTVATPMGNMTVQEAYEIARGNDRALVELVSRFGSNPTGDVVGGSGAGSFGRAAQSGEEPAVLRRLIQENARTVVAQSDAEARQFLMRLADLIKQYRGIEGRKTVVLFSEGFNQQNVTREVEQVAAAAAQSYCVFYSMDLNRRLAGIEQAGTPTTDIGTEINERVEPLGSLAAETDGVLVNNAVDQLEEALDRLATASQHYYLVGFSPAADALSNRGAYRRVSVRVTRPGAMVSARTGYALGPDSTPADRRRTIDAALAAPFVQQGLRIDYTTYVMASEHPGKARVLLSLGAALPVRSASADAADVVFVVRDTRDGRVVASGTDTMSLPDSPASGSATGTGQYRVQFEVPPGMYLMRMVVREPGGLVGSADRRLEVKSLTGPDVAASDLVLASTTGALPVRARVYAGDGLAGLLDTYGRASDSLDEVDVTLELLPEGADDPVASVKGVLEPLQRIGENISRRARFELPLNAVAAGEYVARARVRASGETVAESVRQVEVVAGTAFADATAPAPFRAQDVLSGEVVRRHVDRLKRNPDAPVAQYALRGIDLFGREAFSEAAEALRQALLLDETSATTAFVLGWAYEGAGDTRKAIGAWRAAAVADPKLVAAHLALADAYVRLAAPALAVQALRAGLAALPDSPELKSRLATIEGRMEDPW